MKRTAILAVLIGCSICLVNLNAQITVFSNDVVHIGDTTTPQIKVNPSGAVEINGTVNMGANATIPQLKITNSAVDIGVTGAPQVKLNSSSVTIGNSASQVKTNYDGIIDIGNSTSQIKFNPVDNTFNIGSPTAPQIKVNPSGIVDINGTVNIDNLITPQIKVNNGIIHIGETVSIGNTTTPQIKVNPNGIVDIGGTINIGGNATTPRIKVAPTGTIGINGAVGINGNLSVNNGTVNLGTTSYPQIRINSNGTVDIGNTSIPQTTYPPTNCDVNILGVARIGGNTSRPLHLYINHGENRWCIGNPTIPNFPRLALSPDGVLRFGISSAYGYDVNIPQIEATPDGSVNIGRSNSQQVRVNTSSVTMGNTTSQIKINSDGSINLGNATTPQIKVNPNNTIYIGGTIGLGNTASTPQINITNSTIDIGKTGTAQVRLNSSGITIGNTTSQLKFNPSDNTFSIGSPTSPYFMVYPDGSVSITKSVPSTSVPPYGGVQQYQDIGIKIIATKEATSSSGLAIQSNVMALTGVSNRSFSIGTKTNMANVIYSAYYYSGGAYIGVLASSDSNLKTNIRDLAPMSDKISKLRPVIYDFINDTDITNTSDKTTAKKSKGSGNNQDNSSKGDNENETIKNRAGFLAQEVLDIFPDLVVMGADSMYRLDYAGLIPYLTKALQEQSGIIERQTEAIQEQDGKLKQHDEIIQQQNEKIENLQEQINDIRNGANTADFIIFDETTEESGGKNAPQKAPKISKDGNLLFQNTPNPFNLSTTIKYQLSDNAANAKICIYNLTGKQLLCYNLSAINGINSIEVRASSLQSGMYLYSLMVNDKLIDTKRMVLTE